MGAGNYYDRLRLHVRSIDKNTANGQDEETFTPDAYLWGRVEVESGRKQADYGANQTGADATIYVRNLPTVSALDRIEAVEWEETWVIDRVRRGNNELILDCFRYDELAV